VHFKQTFAFQANSIVKAVKNHIFSLLKADFLLILQTVSHRWLLKSAY